MHEIKRVFANVATLLREIEERGELTEPFQDKARKVAAMIPLAGERIIDIEIAMMKHRRVE